MKRKGLFKNAPFRLSIYYALSVWMSVIVLFAAVYFLADRAFNDKLIENTLNHAPDGTKIKVSLSRSDQTIDIAISDHGPGIPADEHTTIFKPAYRLEQSRASPGNGLGLAVVKPSADLACHQD